MPLEPLNIDEGTDELIAESLKKLEEMTITDKFHYDYLREQMKKSDSIIKKHGFCPLPYKRNEKIFTPEKIQYWNNKIVYRRQTLLSYRIYIDPTEIQNHYDSYIYEIDFKLLRESGYPIPQRVENKMRSSPMPQRFFYEEDYIRDEKLAKERELFSNATNDEFTISGVTVEEVLVYFQGFTRTDKMIQTKVLIILKDGIINRDTAINNLLEIEAFQRQYPPSLQKSPF